MPVTHEPWLVVLSLVVAIQGAYVGLSLAVQVGGSAGLRRRLLLAGAAHLARRSRSGRCISSACWRRGCRSRSTISSFRRCCRSSSASSWSAPRSSRSSAGPLTGDRGWRRPRSSWAAASSSMHYIGMTRAARERAHAHAPVLRRRQRGRSPSPRRGWRCGWPAAAAAARRCSSRRARSASPSPACTTPRWRA